MLHLHTLDIDTLPINVAIYEKDGDDFLFKDFNKLAEKTEKISRHTLLGKKLTDMFPAVKKFGLFDVLLRVEKSGKAELFDLNFYKDDRISGWRRNQVVKLDDGTVAAFYEDCTLEKEKEKEVSKMKTSLNYQKKIFEHIMDSSTTISIQGYNENHNVIYWNKGSELLYGYTKEEAMGNKLESLIIPDNIKSNVSNLIDNWINNGIPIPSSEVILMDKDGNDVHVLSQHVMIYLDNNHYEMYCIDINLKDVDILQDKLITQKNMLQTIMNLIPDLIWLKDPKGKYIACNATVERFYGTKESDIIGKTDFDFMDAELAQLSQESDKLAIKLNMHHSKDEIIHSIDGSYKGYFETIKMPMKDSKGELIGVLSIARDITKHKEKEIELQTYANYDHLTGLANKSLFINRLKHLLNHRESTQQYHAILFIDLDHFKKINDTMGHDTGDIILQKVSTVLQKFIRKEDTVARIGGDEFTILLEDISSPYDAGMIAQKIINALKTSIKIENKHFYISASIGIAISPDDTISADSLLSYADTAMYHAKASGKNNYQFYKKDFSYQAFEKLLIENDLRHALKNKEFVLHYQPQINIKTKHIIGVEALIRWVHPQKGIISPNNFIKIAEISGQFNAIGTWVIKQSMIDICDWKKQKLNIETVSINLTSKQLEDEIFIPTIEALLIETKCHPSWIEFEITEKYIMTDDQITIKKLKQIHELGCKISIEDFGTGYSSLMTLQQLPIQKVIINHQPFIKGIPVNNDNETIITTLLLIAKQLDIDIIVKGIESVKQEKFLLHTHCNLGQGFLYAKPMSKVKLEKEIITFST